MNSIGVQVAKEMSIRSRGGLRRLPTTSQFGN